MRLTAKFVDDQYTSQFELLFTFQVTCIAELIVPSFTDYSYTIGVTELDFLVSAFTPSLECDTNIISYTASISPTLDAGELFTFDESTREFSIFSGEISLTLATSPWEVAYTMTVTATSGDSGISSAQTFSLIVENPCSCVFGDLIPINSINYTLGSAIDYEYFVDFPILEGTCVP